MTAYRLRQGRDEMQAEAIHAYLVRSYWAEGIPLEVVQRSIAGSLCVGAFDGADQVGFARVVTDRATFAYLADVYVLEGHRGQGLARRMVELLHTHPELQGLRNWMLITRDAQGLYTSLGWAPIAEPGRFMQRRFPDVYRR